MYPIVLMVCTAGRSGSISARGILCYPIVLVPVVLVVLVLVLIA